MVWVIVVLAVIVLGLAAWAGTGRLGEMPEVVNDRPKGNIPDGRVDAEFLDKVGFPRASTGYDRAQVDAYLRAFVDGTATTEVLETVFDIVAGGYDMQSVDAVLDRMARESLLAESEEGEAVVDAADEVAEDVEDEVAEDPTDAPPSPEAEAGEPQDPTP